METNTQTEVEKQHGGARNGAGRKPKSATVSDAVAPDAMSELENELTALEREALQLERLEAELLPQLKQHQNGLIAGDANAVTAAAGVTARLNATRERCAEIVVRLPQLENELNAAREAAREMALLDELRVLARSSSEAARELQRERERVNALLVEIAPKLRDLGGALSQHRRAFIQVVGEMSPAVYHMDNPTTSPEKWDAAQIELEKMLAQFEQLENELPDGVTLDALRMPYDRTVFRSYDKSTPTGDALEYTAVIAGIAGARAF